MMRSLSRPTRMFAGSALGVVVALTVAACGSAGTPGSNGKLTPTGGTPGAGTTASPSATAPLPQTGTWRLLPPAPAATSFLTVGVWTGNQMLIHSIVGSGNSSYRGVMLSYTPATGSWRTLAPGPAPIMVQNGEVALWTGSEMLIIGITNAAYNPATNTWRPIARYNGPVGAAYVWTGHQVILWGGGCCGGVTADGGAYTPADNAWQALPPSPLSARHTTGAWTGTELIIAGGRRPSTGAAAIQTSTLADAAAYNPATRTWRTLPPMPEARADATAIWDGSEVLFIGGILAGARVPSADGVAFNPATGRWRRLPAMEFKRTSFAAVWTGHQVLIWGGVIDYGSQTVPPHGVAYDPAANRWTALPQAPLRGRAAPIAVWTGGQMIVWGGAIPGTRGYVYPGDGAAYQPALSSR